MMEIPQVETNFAFQLQQKDFIKRPFFNVTFQDRHYQRESGGKMTKNKVKS